MVEEKSGGTRWSTILAGALGTAAGSLGTALVQTARENPVWLIVMVLTCLLVAVIVAVAWAWVTRRIVHIGEHKRLEVSFDRLSHVTEELAGTGKGAVEVARAVVETERDIPA